MLLTEELDRAPAVLALRLGVRWRGARARRENAGVRSRGGRVRDEPEFRAEPRAFDALWERNVFDREVYAHARARWERDVAEAEAES